MDSLFIYMVKVNAALVVFWLFYRFIFGKDTFLEIKRACLLTILFLSFLYPFLDFSVWIAPEHQAVLVNYVLSFQEVAVTAEMPEPSIITLEKALGGSYLLGVTFLLTRMIIQLLVICRFVWRGRRVNYLETGIIVPRNAVSPFSFFRWIFVDPESYTLREMQEIITHEKAHAAHWHSLDMILSELLCVLFWFNPAVWLLKYEIRQNLEYLADKGVVNAGYNRKNYQYHLLRLSHQSAAAQLINNFNVSQLKKRIIMMNKKRTSRIGLLKYALLLPVTGLLVISSNIQALAHIVPSTEITGQSVSEGEITVKGKVVDNENRPIEGATVVVKGTSVGCVTDQQGLFSLKLHSGQSLFISYIGKKPAELKVGSGESAEKGGFMTVQLGADVQTLDKVVVLGYKKDSDYEMKVMESMPVFPGGKEGMVRFLVENLKYPQQARDKGVEGVVSVNFRIDEKGKVLFPQVAQSVDPDLDKEAVRVVGLMPAWKPAQQQGKAIAVDFAIPVEFRLTEKEAVVSLTKVMKVGDKVLYIIDGKEVPVDFNLNSVDPETIESISVLKEKTAVEVYGKKGENGVILITLKKNKNR